MTNYTKTQNGKEVPLSQEEIDDFVAREKVHNDLQIELAKTRYLQDREIERGKEGVTDSTMIKALWKRVMDASPDDSEAIKVKCCAIDVKFPAPIA